MRRSATAALGALSVFLSGGVAMGQDLTSSAFTLDSGHARTAEQMAMRFDHADLAWRVMPETKSIDGVATLTFTATAPLSQLVLELDRRLPVSAIAIDGQPLAPDAWTNPEGRLAIRLPQALEVNQSVVARIVYGGAPHVAVNAPWDGGFVWAQTPDGRPWVATAVQGEGCDLFWPCIDHPQAGPALVDMRITVPGGLSAPANGELIDSRDTGDGWTTHHWRARQPETYAVSLNIGPFVERRGVFQSRFGNAIPMQFWHLPSDDPADVEDLFAEFPLQLAWYERVIGPFPVADEKMGVVATPHLGMEHQSINAYGNAYAEDQHGYDWLLHHELAHEWFGNQVTNASWDDMWLHEGFAMYMQPLYLRDLRGLRSFHTEMAAQRARILNRHPIVSGRDRTADAVADDATGPGVDIYMKGSHLLHTLRGLIGDAAFFEATRRLVYGRPDPAPGNFQPRQATTPEFIAIVERVSGRDLDWFFDAYLYHAALPDLQIGRDGDRATARWVTPSGAAFPLPVEVEVDGVLRRLTMAGGVETFDAPAAARILIDPHGRVLRRQEEIERMQAWQGQTLPAADQAGSAVMD